MPDEHTAEQSHHPKTCGCGRDHQHEPHPITTTAAPAATSTHGQERHRTSAHGIKRVYTLQNLGCAHCAAEMQRQISQLDGVDDCVLVYKTKQLRVTGKNPDALLPRIREICQSIESETQVIASEMRPAPPQPSACRYPDRRGLFSPVSWRSAACQCSSCCSVLLLGWRVADRGPQYRQGPRV